MSVTIQGHAQRSAAAIQPVDPPRAVRHRDSAMPSADSENKSAGRHPQLRQALQGALSDAMAKLMPTAQGETTSIAPAEGGESKKALQQFRHELFSALRPTAGEAGAPGRHGHGFAWGRATLGDIAQRLESLAQQFAGTTAVDDAVHAATSPTAAAVVAEDPAVSPGVAPAGEPVVASTSPLLSAFQALSNTGSAAPDGAASAASSLSTLLLRIAESLQAEPLAVLPAAGSLVDTTA